jgi:hypothetical protein
MDDKLHHLICDILDDKGIFGLVTYERIHVSDLRHIWR